MAIDRPDLVTDDRFADFMKRLERTEELHAEVEKWTLERTKQEVMKTLGEAGVPCSATMDTVELYDDPHLNERGFIKTLSHPELGDVRMLGFPTRMSANDVEMTPPPELGQHTDSVLASELGLDAETLLGLREVEAIA
jgi:formyl-CoA transferase